MNVLAQTLKRIVDEFGIDTLKNGKKTAALFADLAPQHKQEQTMLRYLIQCGGNAMLIDALNKSSGEQQVAKAKLIRKMMDDCLVSQQAAASICDSFWRAIGGKSIPTTNITYTLEQAPDNLDVYRTVTINNAVRNAPISVTVEVDGKITSVQVPDPVTDGQTYRFPQKGKYDQKSGRTGDLYVTIHVHTNQSSKGIIPVVAAVALALVVIVMILAIATKHGSGGAVLNGTSSSSRPSSSMNNTAKPENSHDHSWNEATYNDPKTCKICGVTEGTREIPGSVLSIRDIVSSASASTVYAGDNLGKHTPEKMYDGKLDTNWTENVSGNGIGEYVVFYFDGVYAVKKMYIYIGSHYSEKVYAQNCRPKAITLTFSDGSTEYVQLKDSYDEQVIVLDRYYYTDYIKLTIEDVYAGTKYLDTVIAELDIAAYRP